MKISILIASLFVVLASSQAHAGYYKTVCDQHTTSAANAYFTGVTNCGDVSRINSAAREACNKAIAKIGSFGDGFSRNYVSSTYTKNVVQRNGVCLKKGPLGTCLSYGRECSTTLTNIRCAYKRCYRVWVPTPVITPAPAPAPAPAPVIIPAPTHSVICKNITNKRQCNKQSQCFWKKAKAKCRSI